MRKKLIRSGVCLGLFLLILILVSFADVQQIGPAGTSVGLAGMNGGFAKAIGTHMWLYKLTNLLGYLALACAAVFAGLGVKQLATRRSLGKVDRQILGLGGLYVVTLGLYVLFEKVVINTRPVLMEGETMPEASFPSSHTVLACVIFGSIAMIIRSYIKDKKRAVQIQDACLILMAVSVLGRLFSGVHWLSDILAGIFLSFALLLAYSAWLDAGKEAGKKE